MTDDAVTETVFGHVCMFRQKGLMNRARIALQPLDMDESMMELAFDGGTFSLLELFSMANNLTTADSVDMVHARSLQCLKRSYQQGRRFRVHCRYNKKTRLILHAFSESQSAPSLSF